MSTVSKVRTDERCWSQVCFKRAYYQVNHVKQGKEKIYWACQHHAEKYMKEQKIELKQPEQIRLLTEAVKKLIHYD